jgi:hypothetical protein
MSLQDLNADPMLVAEILPVLGVAPDELIIVDFQKKVSEIANYLSRFENPKLELLKILNNRSGSGSTLDVVYNYVDLQEQLGNEIIGMYESDGESIDEMIAQEMSKGYMTSKSIDRMLSDLEDKRFLNSKMEDKYNKMRRIKALSKELNKYE